MATNEDFNTKMEHDDIDEDIERLKIVLQDDENEQDGESEGELQVLDENEEEYYSHASRPSTSSSVTASSFPTTSVCTDADDFVYRFDPNTINPDSCLAMNQAYQEVLLDMLRQIEMALTENRTKQKQLEDDLDDECGKSDRGASKDNILTRDYTSPYFKDKEGSTPPFNEDVILKERMHEQKQHVRPKPGWTKAHRKKLLSAVRVDALEQQIRPLLNKLEIETSKIMTCKTTEEISAAKDRIEKLKQAIKDKQKTSTDELLRSVDPNRIDYMKISVTEFKGKYDASECESMWRNVLRPEINREKWTPEEEEKLVELGSKYQMRNWKQIAEELGTHRTPFQCLQHYQQNNVVYDTSDWTAEEDELLREVVETCKYGVGKLQWHQVAYYVEGRSALMCEARWRKINPDVKKGKWTPQEDCLLLTAVHMFSDNNWLRIQEYIPGRTAPQCRERWVNCLDPHLKAYQWTYEEDKILMRQHQQYGNSWSEIATKMPGRTDSMVLARYNRLQKWKQTSEHFFSQPIDVQKEMLSTAFEFGPDSQILPRKIRKQTRRRKRIKIKAEEGVPVKEEPESESDEEAMLKAALGIQELEWNSFAKDQDIQLDDYQKQHFDMINNEIVVPRPPPMRRYTARSYSVNWDKRMKLQELVQMQINSSVKALNAEQMTDPQTIVDHVSSSLEPVFKDQKKWDMISSAMKGKLPNELSVRELLDISRGIKKKGRPPRRPREEWEEYDETSEEEEVVESSEEEESEEEVVKPTKPKKEQTEQQKAIMASRIAKLAKHRSVGSQLREIVQAQMATNDLVPARRGRRRSYHIYPPHLLKPAMDHSEEQKLNRKSLVLLMKTLDVDCKAAYHRARLSKRKISAMALLKSAQNRTRHSRQISQVDSELAETSECLLDLRKELGIKDDDVFENAAYVEVKGDDENDIDEDLDDDSAQTEAKAPSTFGTETENGVNEVEKAGPSDEPLYDKSLPYIPPNQTNLRAMKTLLLEHRCMIDTAGKYFDPEELKQQLYAIKSRGPNPLMQVLSSVGKSDDVLYKRKMKQDEVIDPKLEKTSAPGDVLKYVRKTKAYLQLKARFQSVFTWPALLSTINPPKKGTPLPLSLQRTPEPVETDEKHNLDIMHDLTAQNDDVTAENDDVTAGNSDITAENDDVTDLTEEEAIERLVEKIMDEYKTNREGSKRSKRYVHTKKHRKKLSDNMAKAVYDRERSKILKRLGLYEKMQQYEKQRLEQQKGEITNAGEEGEKNEDIEAGDTEHNMTLPDTQTGEMPMEQTEEQSPSQTTPERTTRRKGRPVGARNTCFNPPDEKSRRSARAAERMVSKAAEFQDRDLELISSPSCPKRKKTVEIRNKRLKELIPEKMGKLVSKISDLPIMKEPLPEPSSRTLRSRKDKEDSTKSAAADTNPNDAETNLSSVGTTLDIADTDSAGGRKNSSSALVREDLQGSYSNLPANENTGSVLKLETPQLVQSAQGESAVTSVSNSMSVGNESLNCTNVLTSVASHNPLAMLGTVAGAALGQSPMFVAIPVTVGGTQQIACIPLYPDKDGKLVMPNTGDVVSAATCGDVTSTLPTDSLPKNLPNSGSVTCGAVTSTLHTVSLPNNLPSSGSGDTLLPNSQAYELLPNSGSGDAHLSKSSDLPDSDNLTKSNIDEFSKNVDKSIIDLPNSGNADLSNSSINNLNSNPEKSNVDNSLTNAS